MNLADNLSLPNPMLHQQLKADNLQLRVIRKDVRISQNGSPYNALELTDYSSQCSCLVWWNRFQWTNLDIAYGDIYSFSGCFTQLGESKVLVASAVEPVDPSAVTPAALFANQWLSGRASNLGWRFVQVFNQIRNPLLQSLIIDVFLNPVVALGYATNQGSLGFHHSWRHGLMEHSLELAEEISTNHDLNETDRDTGIVVALLHDIGKSVTTVGTSRTALGKLQPHDMSALELLAEPLKRLDRHNSGVANEIRSFFKPKAWFPKSHIPAIEQVRQLDQACFV